MTDRHNIPAPVWRPLAEAIAAEHGMTAAQILKRSTRRESVVPRFNFWKALRALPAGYTLQAIGNLTGHGHTAVSLGLRSPTANLKAGTKRPRALAPRGPLRTLVGERFGKLVVIAQASEPPGQRKHRSRWWLCRCDCGRDRVAQTDKLHDGTAFHCKDHRCRVPNHTVEGGATALRELRASQAARFANLKPANLPVSPQREAA